MVSATWARTTPVCAPETTIKTVVSGTAPQNMSSFLICSLFGFCRFLLLTWCAWNHYFYSGFRHTTKTHRGVLTWNHYKNSGFRHSAQKHFSTREAQKVKFRWRNLALRRSTQRTFGKVPFFLILRTTSRNPYFCSVFGTSRSDIVKNAFFWKPLKTRDRKKKSAFSTYLSAFSRATKPLFL